MDDFLATFILQEPLVACLFQISFANFIIFHRYDYYINHANDENY